MKFLSRFYIGLIFLILYAPILVVILFSFNESESLSHF
ncbi:MAG: ABC transporter permease, partial [Ruminococcaceae bacterium]|nr:ABC transporter permease [Oscillospiraceae bacterium]